MFLILFFLCHPNSFSQSSIPIQCRPCSHSSILLIFKPFYQHPAPFHPNYVLNPLFPCYPNPVPNPFSCNPDLISLSSPLPSKPCSHLYNLVIQTPVINPLVPCGPSPVLSSITVAILLLLPLLSIFCYQASSHFLSKPCSKSSLPYQNSPLSKP